MNCLLHHIIGIDALADILAGNYGFDAQLKIKDQGMRTIKVN